MKAVVIEQLSLYRYKIQLLDSKVVKTCHGEQLRKYQESQRYEHLPIPNRAKILEENDQESANEEQKNEIEEIVINPDSEEYPNQNDNEMQRKSDRLKDKNKPEYHETKPRKPIKKKKKFVLEID